MLPSPHLPPTLADWLAIATGKLVPSAQTRVRAEIESHYAEAVQAYLQHGQTESAAQATALADLGDARCAARRFCRQYVTRRETKGFRDVIQGRAIAVSTIMYLFAWAGFTFVILQCTLHSRLSDAFWGSFIFAPLAVTIMATLGVHLLSRHERPRRKFLWRIFASITQMLNVLVMMIVAFQWIPQSHFAKGMAIPVMAIAIAIFGLYLLQRKFRSAPAEDLTPLDPSEA